MCYGWPTNQTLASNEGGLEMSLSRGNFVPPRLQICEQQVVVVLREQKERQFYLVEGNRWSETPSVCLRRQRSEKWCKFLLLGVAAIKYGIHVPIANLRSTYGMVDKEDKDKLLPLFNNFVILLRPTEIKPQLQIAFFQFLCREHR